AWLSVLIEVHVFSYKHGWCEKNRCLHYAEKIEPFSIVTDLTPDHLSARLGEASSGINYAPNTRTDEAAYGQEEKSEELSGGATQWCRLGKLEFGEEGVVMRAMWIKKAIVECLTAD